MIKLQFFVSGLSYFLSFGFVIGVIVLSLFCGFYANITRGMLLLTKAKRPLKFKMLCGFNKHAVKLSMHKAAPYAFPIPLNTF